METEGVGTDVRKWSGGLDWIERETILGREGVLREDGEG
jgi:hypothetical protein